MSVLNGIAVIRYIIDIQQYGVCGDLEGVIDKSRPNCNKEFIFLEMHPSNVCMDYRIS